jgi:hypothetical protein
MGLFDSLTAESQAHDDYHNVPHKAEITHELLAGAAAFSVSPDYTYFIHKTPSGITTAHDSRLLKRTRSIRKRMGNLLIMPSPKNS